MAELKRKRGRPRTFQRQRAVSAAMEHYWKDGLVDLSVNEVCRRTGLSKTSLYRELGGEDALHDAVLERYFAVIISPVVARLDPQRPFAEATTTIVDFVAGAGQGCLLVKMRGARSRLGPLAGARVDVLVGELRAVYEALFIGGRDRGELRTDIAPRTAALYLDTQVSSALRLGAAGERPEDIRDEIRLALSALHRR